MDGHGVCVVNLFLYFVPADDLATCESDSRSENLLTGLMYSKFLSDLIDPFLSPAHFHTVVQ